MSKNINKIYKPFSDTVCWNTHAISSLPLVYVVTLFIVDTSEPLLVIKGPPCVLVSLAISPNLWLSVPSMCLILHNLGPVLLPKLCQTLSSLLNSTQLIHTISKFTCSLGLFLFTFRSSEPSPYHFVAFLSFVLLRPKALGVLVLFFTL